MADEVRVWLIGECDSKGDFIDIWRVKGTDEDVKNFMFERIEVLEEEFGKRKGSPKTIEEIETISGDMLYTCPCWSDRYLGITACVETDPIDLTKKKKT